jgi:predicted nucleic acid-binding protein
LRIYLDAAPVIYLIERTPPFYAIVQSRLASPQVIPVASSLTRMECLVKPLQINDPLLLRDFEQYFDNVVAQIVPLSGEVMNKAAEIRAQYRFKTPDAIHLAAAHMSNCDVFLTNDHRLDRFTEISVKALHP